jgi:hypothetical protein
MHAPAEDNLSPIWLFLAGDHPEQGRLPRSVGPDQAQAISRPQAQRTGREEDFLAISFFNLFDLDQGNRLFTPLLKKNRANGSLTPLVHVAKMNFKPNEKVPSSVKSCGPLFLPNKTAYDSGRELFIIISIAILYLRFLFPSREKGGPDAYHSCQYV